MTTAEIKALVAETKQALAEFDPPLAPSALPHRLIAAIETLLAREAEVLEYIDEYGDNRMAATYIRAILNPENET